jgi:hypothetical protein
MEKNKLNSFSVKLKIAAVFIIILGLVFLVFPVLDIRRGGYQMLSRYGGRTIYADKEPFSYWLHVVFDSAAGLIILGAGIFMMLYKTKEDKKI